ncbi:MAG: deoxynucleoside kinase [Pseudomonadota bacterium]
MNQSPQILDVVEDKTILRYQIPHRLTRVVRRLMKYFKTNSTLVTCIGNIGAGKSSLVKVLAYNTGMNALFELPDEGFEDHFVHNESLSPLLATAKNTAKRTLGRYYGAINSFIECQSKETDDNHAWKIAKENLENAALDIQHAYLDLRKMQLQTVTSLERSTCIDGSSLADRYAFCEVLHKDMDVPYLTQEGVRVVDERLENEFKSLVQPGLVIFLHGPTEYLFQNIRERARNEEKSASVVSNEDIPEGLSRLVRSLNNRYDNFVDTVRETGWYTGPVLKVDVSKIDFISNVKHLIAVYEGIEKLLIPEDFKI